MSEDNKSSQYRVVQQGCWLVRGLLEVTTFSQPTPLAATTPRTMDIKTRPVALTSLLEAAWDLPTDVATCHDAEIASAYVD